MINESYAGIGSRETPEAMSQLMRKLAKYLAEIGWTLRSGAADGADSAFEAGAVEGNGFCEIYLPWKGFNRHRSSRYVISDEARALAKSVHPVWDELSEGPKQLHARNCYQVMGRSLAEPVKFVVCWTADGCESEESRTRNTGGTGTAIAIASRLNIPVFNLRNEDALDRLSELVGGLPVEFLPVKQSNLF